MVCPSGLGITLQLLSLIGLCLLWNNNGFIRPLKSAERIRITCYGQSWSQHNLPFSSLTSTPSTVQQLSTEILMNANATATTTAGSGICKTLREDISMNDVYSSYLSRHISKLSSLSAPFLLMGQILMSDAVV
jgi:hypothetical protein